MRHVALALLLSALIIAASAANAAAVIVNVGGTAFSVQPVAAAAAKAESAPATPVEYHGGPVMASNTNYTLYWDPSGGPEYPAGYVSGISRYFEDLAHDSGGVQNTDSVLTQYGDVAGEFANYNSRFGGALLDTNPYPSNGCKAAPICLTDEQLRSEIAKYVEAHALASDLQHEYFLLTPPGVESCLDRGNASCSAGTRHSAYCAYHSYITVGQAVIIYANDPYVSGLNCDVGEEHPNNNPSDAAIGGGLAHEHSESVTDPELSAWYDSKRREVGDKCRTLKAATEYGPPLGKAPDGANYNQVLHEDLYYYQQEWSNAAGGCKQRAGATGPAVTRVAPKAGPSSGGTSVAITGTNFQNPASVKFGAASAAAVTVNSPTSITTVSPAGARGVVDVTVTTAGGTSATSSKDHFRYR